MWMMRNETKTKVAWHINLMLYVFFENCIVHTEYSLEGRLGDIAQDDRITWKDLTLVIAHCLFLVLFTCVNRLRLK